MKIDSFFEKWYQEIELLTEGKQVGTVYHFTRKLLMITSDFTDSNPILKSSAQESHLSNTTGDYNYISTTRKYDLSSFGNVRFTLNGNKLSQKYMIEPINYFVASDLRSNKQDREITKAMRNKVRSMSTRYGQEYEERIWVPENQPGISLRDYCVEVVIDISAEINAFGTHNLKAAQEYFFNLGIPVIITTKFKPYGKDKGILIPDIPRDLNFENGSYINGYFGYINLRRANFRNANLQGANFEGTDLEGADFTGADLKDATFKEARLKNANLTNVNLINANLTNANLTNANLENANLVGTKLKNGSFFSANLRKTNFKNLEFRGVILTYADFTDANLENVEFTRSQLKSANFTNVKFKQANFRLEILTEVDFSNVTFEDVDFEHALLYGANFQRAYFENVNFRYADLRNVDFKYAKNLDKAKNLYTSQYNANTAWPAGFDIENYKRNKDD